MNVSFFGELLQSISESGRVLLERAGAWRRSQDGRPENILTQCEDLLSSRGEASGAALAWQILDHYAALAPDQRAEFFEALARDFGANNARLEAAVNEWRANPGHATVSELHIAAEPRRQELFRRLNLAPGGTAALVKMREQLLDALAHHPALSAVDADLVHLLSSWFNRGFLVLKRIDWSTSASILEKIIRHEAVHEIKSWDDLRRRIDPPDRHCYAFFHPALVDEPLIFVEVALADEIAGAIAPILAVERDLILPERATTAIFYSISNCQRGLAGVSFGNFLIKQVIDDVSRNLPNLSTFVTLSPVPGFAAWLKREREKDESNLLSSEDRTALMALDIQAWWADPGCLKTLHEPMLRAAASYFLRARNARGLPVDPVARFHLGNGARLEQIHLIADTSEKGLRQSHGVMVNYLYDLNEIERNHEAYARGRMIAASGSVRKIAGVTAIDSAAVLARTPLT